MEELFLLIVLCGGKCVACGEDDSAEHRAVSEALLDYMDESEAKWWRNTRWTQDTFSAKRFLFLEESVHQLQDCLRFRGLIPYSMSTAIAECDAPKAIKIGTGVHKLWYTDGSKPSARRAMAPDYAG